MICSFSINNLFKKRYSILCVFIYFRILSVKLKYKLNNNNIITIIIFKIITYKIQTYFLHVTIILAEHLPQIFFVLLLVHMLFDTVYVLSKYVSGFVMLCLMIFLLLLLKIVWLDFCSHLKVVQLIEIRSLFLKYFLLLFLCIISRHLFLRSKIL